MSEYDSQLKIPSLGATPNCFDTFSEGNEPTACVPAIFALSDIIQSKELGKKLKLLEMECFVHSRFSLLAPMLTSLET